MPEEKYDFRTVDNDKIKADSVRESLAHLINVERSYLRRSEKGNGIWGQGNYFDESLHLLSKTELLLAYDQAYQEIFAFLCDEAKCNLPVTVKWSDTPVTALRFIWGMNDHEIFHNGYNVAFMDHLEIERFESLTKMWG